MFAPRPLLTRSLATLLPACLVWVFAACVSICSAHPAEAPEAIAAAYCDAADAAPEPDCCPITEASQGVLPERPSPSGQAAGDLHTPAAMVTEPGRSRAARSAPAPASFASLDPPFGRLRTLRV